MKLISYCRLGCGHFCSYREKVNVSPHCWRSLSILIQPVSELELEFLVLLLRGQTFNCISVKLEEEYWAIEWKACNTCSWWFESFSTHFFVFVLFCHPPPREGVTLCNPDYAGTNTWSFLTRSLQDSIVGDWHHQSHSCLQRVSYIIEWFVTSHGFRPLGRRFAV